MPLEIRELVIKVTINEARGNNPDVLTQEKVLELKNKIIKECVEKVIATLERTNER